MVWGNRYDFRNGWWLSCRFTGVLITIHLGQARDELLFREFREQYARAKNRQIIRSIGKEMNDTIQRIKMTGHLNWLVQRTQVKADSRIKTGAQRLRPASSTRPHTCLISLRKRSSIKWWKKKTCVSRALSRLTSWIRRPLLFLRSALQRQRGGIWRQYD